MTYVSNACFNCRALHRRCNGVKPCSNCIQRNVECVFHPPTKRGPKPRSQKKEDLNKTITTSNTSNKTTTGFSSAPSTATPHKSNLPGSSSDPHLSQSTLPISGIQPLPQTQPQLQIYPSPQLLQPQQLSYINLSSKISSSGVKSTNSSDSLNPLSVAWRQIFLEMISKDELPPPSQSAYNIAFYSRPTTSTSVASAASSVSTSSTFSNETSSNKNTTSTTNTFNFNFMPAVYNIEMNSPSTSIHQPSLGSSQIDVKIEPWTPAGHIVLTCFLNGQYINFSTHSFHDKIKYKTSLPLNLNLNLNLSHFFLNFHFNVFRCW